MPGLGLLLLWGEGIWLVKYTGAEAEPGTADWLSTWMVGLGFVSRCQCLASGMLI